MKYITMAVMVTFTTFAAFAFVTIPAVAAGEESISEVRLESNSGAGKVEMTSGATSLVDGSTSLKCSESVAAGSLKEGAKLSAAGVMKITTVTWNKGTETCEGPLGVKFKVEANTSSPWELSLQWQLAANHNLVFGYIEKIEAHVSWSGCKFVVKGKVATLIHFNKTSPTMLFLFSRKINEEFNEGKNGLEVEKVEESGLGCLGLVKNGDKPYFESEKGYETTAPTLLTYEREK